MKNTYILTLILFIISCGETVREEITDRYVNGQKKLLVKYKGEGVDEVVVERITYNENGDILKLIQPLEKLEMLRFYRDNGKIMFEQNFKDGKRDGKYIDYLPNGKIMFEQNYKNDIIDGKCIWYHENGQIEEEGNYKDGKKDGKWIWYYEGGQIFGEGNYKDGERDGKWTTYNEDGSIKKVEEYKDGKLVE